MRIIQKQISLESITSRLPSVWPSYINNERNGNGEPKVYYFDDGSLSARSYTYTSNWGMIPMNIVITPNPSAVTSDDDSIPLNERKPRYSDYSITNGCHCYGRYTTDSGTPINCFDEDENIIKCQIDDYGKTIDGNIPFYYDERCDFVLSFERLSKWYNKFVEYYNLLTKYGHCNRVYTSAEDYYNYESGTKYMYQMKLGIDKQAYIDLDNEFANMGGKVEVLTFNKKSSEYSEMTPTEAHDEDGNDELAIVGVYDIGFFKWICENVVPSFEIPNRYRNYWKRGRLFYPDVIKWLAWFKVRDYESVAEFVKGTDGEVDTWNCKASGVSDCCDCEEFFKRGGKDIFSAMTEWYNNVQSSITANNEAISGSVNCFIPTIVLPTDLQITIDDLGEMSIFSKDYELGTDYRTAGLWETQNTHSGTVVTMDGNSMILSGGSGYTFDSTYMEKQRDGWIPYTDYYINKTYDNDEFKYDYKNDFYVSAVTFFTYDVNNVKYTTSASTLEDAQKDFEAQMSSKYLLSIRDNGWILVSNELHEIKEAEFANYDETNKYIGKKLYMVFRENNTNTPYTFINGSKVYAEFYAPKNKFYFPFFKKEGVTTNSKTFNINDYIEFDRNKLKEPTMLYINYNGSAYEVKKDDDTITIEGAEYYRVSGYCTDDSNNILYLTQNGEIRSGDTMEEIPSESAVVSSSTEYYDEKPFINVKYPFDVEIYQADKINGKTVSKLGDLALFSTLTDNIGNNIDGIYEIGDEGIYNHQPPQGSVLELIYQVGNTSKISRFSQTHEKLSDVEDNKNYFVGNIITRMKFYYKETNDSIPEKTIVDVHLLSSDTYTVEMENDGSTTSVTSGYTSLSAISISTSAKTELEEMEDELHIFYDDIFCDVTYCIGATLSRREGENYCLSIDEGLCNHGVEYTETVQFVKENREFYLKKPKDINKVLPIKRNDVSAHSISYPIYVYQLTQKYEHVDDSQYDSSYEVPMADFNVDINIFSGDGDTYSQKYGSDMANHNNMQVFPTFREEYKLGISTLENVDSDIYIDRGINSAFEKHLKLGEVHTLESLIKYNNGYFKITDN